ncbi:hypothetical protein CRUP_023513 [Coryphaenoides rupestris]|nr:hypothetical protein CRUP_023513 [Coryphaenoides rupestris]
MTFWREVGWRAGAKRLLLLMTDEPSHLALDSRLAGIVRPNDGLCHLDHNVYTESTSMDHPSVNQLSDKLLENHILSIFAVEKQQYEWDELRCLRGAAKDVRMISSIVLGCFGAEEHLMGL